MKSSKIQWYLVLFSAFYALPVDAELFEDATAAYRKGDFPTAASLLQRAVAAQHASGTLQNLGNAAWQGEQKGGAILAWEQALWLDPFNGAARNNLKFARKVAQLEAPDLAWYEVVSSWLPANCWGWMAGVSLWVAVGLVMLPGIFRRRKKAWHQAAAALSLMVFLLCVPACYGVQTRARIGFVLGPDTQLRLTPTLESQTITRMAPGEPARCERARGDYVLIRTSRSTGWLRRDEFRLVASD